MPEITTELVKELRNSTGISVMQCRRALEEAGGDMEKALAILKKSSSDIALKKQDRSATDGNVIIKSTAQKAILLTLHCETDFVSKNEDFVKLGNDLADKALSDGIENMKANAKEMIDLVIQKTGEKIELGDIYEIDGEVLGNYIHNNKLGVVVSLSGGNENIAKDIAMHFAAMKPEYISPDQIDENAKNLVKEICEKEVAESDKPAEIKPKILEGKINTYFKERTLLSQPFIKNPDQTIADLLEKNGAKIKEIKYSFI